jgi:hypothetical protein
MTHPDTIPRPAMVHTNNIPLLQLHLFPTKFKGDGAPRSVSGAMRLDEFAGHDANVSVSW